MEEENKKRKKKMFIALVSLCSVLALTIVAMGIVWAATQQHVQSNVRVFYTATDVAGSLSANVYFNSDTAVAMTTNGQSTGGETVVTFAGEDAETTGSLSPVGSTQLLNQEGQRFVVFEYIITNASTNDMSAVLGYADDTTGDNVADKNIKIYAYTADAAVANPTTTGSATIYGTSNANLLAKATGSQLPASPFISATVGANATKYCYILVAIENVANDAEFSGVFTWTFTKAATQQGSGS